MDPEYHGKIREWFAYKECIFILSNHKLPRVPVTVKGHSSDLDVCVEQSEVSTNRSQYRQE